MVHLPSAWLHLRDRFLAANKDLLHAHGFAPRDSNYLPVNLKAALVICVVAALGHLVSCAKGKYVNSPLEK